MWEIFEMVVYVVQYKDMKCSITYPVLIINPRHNPLFSDKCVSDSICINNRGKLCFRIILTYLKKHILNSIVNRE